MGETGRNPNTFHAGHACLRAHKRSHDSRAPSLHRIILWDIIAVVFVAEIHVFHVFFVVILI